MQITPLIKKTFQSQSFKNSFWPLLGATIYPALVLLLTPSFIKYLGDQQFGIWIFIQTVLQMLGAMNLGIGDASIKNISEQRTAGNYNEVNRIFSTAIILTSLLVLIIVSLSLLVLNNLDLFYKSYDTSSNDSLVKIIRVSLLIFALKFFEQLALAVFQGLGRYDLSSRLMLFSKILILLSNILCLFWGGKIFDLIIYTLVVQGFCVLFDFVYLKSKYGFIKFHLVYKEDTSKSLIKYGFWAWLQSMLAIATTQADKLIVASFSGLVTLGYYSLGSMLTTHIHSVLYSISSWIFPAVAEKKANGDSLDEFYNKSQALLMSFGVLIILILLLFDQYIFVFWLGEETFNNSIHFIRPFIFYNLFLMVNIIPYFFLNGSGHVKTNTYIEFLLKFSNIIGMLIGHRFLGDVGLVWGLIISSLIVTPVRIYFCLFNLDSRAIFSQSLLSILPNLFMLGIFVNSNPLLKFLFSFLFLISFYKIFLKPSLQKKIFLNYDKVTSKKSI